MASRAWDVCVPSAAGSAIIGWTRLPCRHARARFDPQKAKARQSKMADFSKIAEGLP
jgi:hypothetical protein